MDNFFVCNNDSNVVQLTLPIDKFKNKNIIDNNTKKRKFSYEELYNNNNKKKLNI